MRVWFVAGGISDERTSVFEFRAAGTLHILLLLLRRGLGGEQGVWEVSGTEQWRTGRLRNCKDCFFRESRLNSAVTFLKHNRLVSSEQILYECSQSNEHRLLKLKQQLLHSLLSAALCCPLLADENTGQI